MAHWHRHPLMDTVPELIIALKSPMARHLWLFGLGSGLRLFHEILDIVNAVASHIDSVHPASCFGIDGARENVSIWVSTGHVDEVKDDLGIPGGDDGLGEDTGARSLRYEGANVSLPCLAASSVRPRSTILRMCMSRICITWTYSRSSAWAAGWPPPLMDAILRVVS